MIRVNETYISFYLRSNRIHIFVDALRGIRCPKYICLLMQKDGRTLAIVPYKKKDFRSHRVSQDVYDGTDGMEVCSLKLCQIIANLYNWDPDCSYRVPGYVLSDHSAAIFNLRQAEIIDKPFCNLR